MMRSTSSPTLHDPSPPQQPTSPQCPAAGGSVNTPVRWHCVRVTGGGEGVVLEEVELSERLIGRLIRQWRSKAGCHRWAGLCLFIVTVVTY